MAPDGSLRPPFPTGPVQAPAPAPIPSSGPASPPGPPGGARAHRSAHRKSPASRRLRLSRRDRLVAISVFFIGVLTIGLATGFGTESSAEPTVRAFLFDWQQQRYDAAAALTTGAPSAVVTAMQTELADLDGTAMFLKMGSVRQSGQTAQASFTASVDLAEGGHQWIYTGDLTLRSTGSGWKVQWAPSVIHPSLGPGDRLAVLTTYAPRAQVQDSSGHSLLTASTAHVVGVTPGKLSDEARTASSFAKVAGLDQAQVLGQIRAAPPLSFLPLLTLDQTTFDKLLPRLEKVPGLTQHTRGLQAFGSLESDLVGRVGTENSPELLAQGEAYQPGATIGTSGLEHAYQTALVGTPSTDVMVVNSAGHVVSTLKHWAGTAGTPVRTTISSPAQAAAASALGSSPGSSGEIIAVQASTGKILADVEHTAAGQELPSGGTVNAQAQPGMAFTIVSAAALLGSGYPVNRQVPCQGSAMVGGQTFTTTSASSSPPPFTSDFANGCVTAFANLSTLLSSSQLGEMEKGFGVGMSWNLPVSSFSGSADTPNGLAGLAADAIGRGGVRMSPLGMALVAAEVDAGVGHDPAILQSDPADARPAPLSTSALVALRGLMRQAVHSGAAHAADVSGGQVFGQAGLVKTGHNWLSWFTGYRGDVAFTVLETSSTARQAAAAMAGAFLSAMR
jgi:cell division protein FtsI/penicillin-binding protein 2